MRVLIIGGTNHIGPYLVQRLVDRGEQVTVVNRGSRNAKLPRQTEFLTADIYQAGALAAAIGDRTFDAAIHMIAGSASSARAVLEPLRGKIGRYLQCGSTGVFAPLPHCPGDERQELTAIIQELYARNLITASGGNVSLRATGREDKIWITPSGLFKGALQPEMMVPLDLAGRVLDRNAAAPSIEKWMHIAILKRRPDLNGVIHTHAPWATLLALSETPFLPISVEAALIGRASCRERV